MKFLAMSSVYETEPMYLDDQGWFLNCVVVVETDIEPVELLGWLKETETKMGRDQQAARNTPRLIDMDILFYGERVVSAPALQVPHPRIAERAFVLVPLDEVRPLLVHPVLRKTMAELLEELHSRKGVVKRHGPSSGFLPFSPPQRPEPPATSP
jgi:2-amino-4-hydroxy-6-hydroxymethyldihydropteridine diphosphokinase